jgi:hypothetical protein
MIANDTSRLPGRYAAVILISQYFLMLSAYLILSTTINWPVSLDDPASIALPRLLEFAQPIRTGYIFYLTVGILFIPATIALNARLRLTGALAHTTLALAIFSAVAKSIGISRWLFAMPVLAHAYVAPGADTATIGVVFDMLNEYAGGIGEILGVGLLSGVWTLLVGGVIFSKPGRFTKPLGSFVVVTGVLLLATVPAGFGVESILGIAMGDLLTLNGIVWQAGLLLIGLWSLTAPRHA